MSLFNNRQYGKTYFELLGAQAVLLSETGQTLEKIFTCFNFFELPAAEEKIKRKSEKTQEISNEVLKMLYDDFLPPLDRDDIYQITSSLAELTKTEEKIFLCLQNLNISEIGAQESKMMKIIKRLSDSALKIIDELVLAEKSKTMKNLLTLAKEERNILEKSLLQAEKELCQNFKSNIYALKWLTVFQKISNLSSEFKTFLVLSETAFLKTF